MCLGNSKKTKPNKNYRNGMKPWEFEAECERVDRND